MDIVECSNKNCNHKWVKRIPNPIRCPQCNHILIKEKVTPINIIEKDGVRQI